MRLLKQTALRIYSHLASPGFSYCKTAIEVGVLPIEYDATEVRVPLLTVRLKD